MNVTILISAAGWEIGQVHDLDQLCYKYMRMGFRPNTFRNKRLHVNTYLQFCDRYSFNPFPIDEWQLTRYTAYLAEQESIQASGTVTNYVSGIRNVANLAGYSVPLPNSPNLRLILDGVKTALAKPANRADTMTMEILKKMAPHVDYQDSFQVCAFTAILVGFYLFLRKSNMVPDSTPKFNPQEQLTRGCLVADWEACIALVHIRWSKTIHNFDRELWLPLIPAEDANICPVLHVRLMTDMVETSGDDPLFSFKNKQGVKKALTYDQLRKQLKTWVALAERLQTGLHHIALGGGGASHAFHVGLSSDYIKLMGDWASDAYITYLCVNLDHRVEAAAQFMYG